MVIRRWGLLAALIAVIVSASAIGSVKAEADGDELVFIETGDSLAVRGFEARSDLRFKHRFRDGFSARIKPGLRKELEGKGFKIREVPVYHTSVLPGDPTPYGIEQIYNDPAITATSGGAGITIGHLDTGVDINHPDLEDRIVGCKDTTSSSGIVDGCDDWHGHGTHTAGSAVADGGPSGTGIYGVAPEADLYAVRVCTSDGCPADDIAAAIRYLGRLQDASGDPLIDIISMSIGGNKSSTLIADAIADHPNILFVAAAGNDGPGEGSIDYPAWDPRVVAVGAVNSNKTVARFSSRGLDDGDDSVISSKEVELAAAGVKVESTYPGGEYALFNGTSMATPQVAGLAAREWQGDAASTRAYLRSLAEDITSASGGGAGTGYDIGSGYGLPHLTTAAPPPPPSLTAVEVTPASASIEEGDTQQYQATASYSDGSIEDITDSANWNSSDTGIATINNSGMASGVSAGTAEITASMDGVTSDAAMLEVTAPPQASLVSIDVTPASASIEEGDTQQYQAMGSYSDGSTLDITNLAGWSSSDTSVADISSAGLATGSSAGTTEITASLQGIVSTPANLEVTAPPPAPTLDAIEINPVKASIKVGNTQSYEAIAKYSDGSARDVTNAADWDSSDGDIAAFSNPGTAKGMSQGFAEVAASMDGITSNIASLEVTQAPSSVTVHIADLDGKARSSRNWWRSVVDITVHDSDHNPVSRAKVTGRWSLPILAGVDAIPADKKSMPRDMYERLFGSFACKTNGKGVCRIQGPVVLNFFDSVNFEVKSIRNTNRHKDMDYNPSDNHDPDGDSDGTLITIAKP